MGVGIFPRKKQMATADNKMATAIWPLGKMAKKRTTKSTPIVFAFFRLFFACFSTSLARSTLFGLHVSDHFGPCVFAHFRTIRLLPFSGCQLDSPDSTRKDRKIPNRTQARLQKDQNKTSKRLTKDQHLSQAKPYPDNPHPPN